MQNPEEDGLLGPAGFVFQTPAGDRKPRKAAGVYPKRRGLVRSFARVARQEAARTTARSLQRTRAIGMPEFVGNRWGFRQTLIIPLATIDHGAAADQHVRWQPAAPDTQLTLGCDGGPTTLCLRSARDEGND